MNRNAFGLRQLLRATFGNMLLPVRAESGRWLWYPPAEYPSLLRGIGRFEPDEVARWRALLRGGDLVYDVGANIGITAHRIYGLLQGNCKILAFEPVPRTAKFLEMNAANLRGTTTVVRSAVGDVEGTVLFRENRRHGGLSARADIVLAERDAEFWLEQSQFEAAMCTLDGIARETGSAPNFVKVDVEGAGHFVVRGARDLLRTARPIWSISLHNATESAGIFKALGDAGYMGVRFGANADTQFCGLAEADGGMFVHPESPYAARIGPSPH